MLKNILIATCASTIVTPLIAELIPELEIVNHEDTTLELPAIASPQEAVKSPVPPKIPLFTIDDKGAKLTGAGVEELQSDLIFVNNGAANRLSVEIDSQKGSSVLDVKGTTHFDKTSLHLIPSQNGIGLNTTYTLLKSAEIEGNFSEVSLEKVNPNLVKAAVILDKTMVQVSFIPSFANIAISPNEKVIASILDHVVPSSPFAKSFLGALVEIPDPDALRVIDELSGNQHTVDLFTNSVLTRNFLRRLYDPIRDWVTTLPCQSYEMECYSGIDTWIEGGYARQTMRNNGNGFGYNSSGWELTFGFQNHFNSEWIAGVAGSYVTQTLDYNLGGHGDLTGGFAGFYVLYRPEYFYALGNVAYGSTQNHIFRKARAGNVALNAHSRPETTEWGFYAESGVDLPVLDILVQPFVGIEGFTARRGSFTEEDGDLFNLAVSKKDRATAASRFGLHVSTTEWYSDFSFSVDIAWQYLLTTSHSDLWLKFDTFGPQFLTQGVKIPRNSADGAITLEYLPDETVEFYGQFAGQVWSNITSFSVLVGLQLRW